MAVNLFRKNAPTLFGPRHARRRIGAARLHPWVPGILNGDGWKPIGMHWSTFERLQAEHQHHLNAALAGMAVKLGLLNERLGAIDRRLGR